MSEETLEFVDDKLFAYKPLPLYGVGVCKVQLVMTKEIFQECYKRWVEPQESEKINCKSTKCENCTNHNYCDYEPQESEDKE